MSAAEPNSNPPTPIGTAWKTQATWSQVANELKSDLTRWRNLATCAGVAAAFLETLSATEFGTHTGWRWFRTAIALVGALILAVVPFVVKNKLSKERVSAWVRARSAAEALKGTIYRFLLGATPFHRGSHAGELTQQIDKIKGQVKDLNEFAALVQPVAKAGPESLIINEYVTIRVTDQIEKFYEPKARANAQAAKRLRDCEFWLGMLAGAMGAIAGCAVATGVPQLSIIGPWVAVVTTASAAVTAHLAASRFEYQAITYFATADRLNGLRDAWLVDPNKLEAAVASQFVDDCERVISAENEAWLTEVAREPGKSP